jgi:hypothetical protein
MSLKHDADNTLWLEQMVRAQASRIEQLETALKCADWLTKEANNRIEQLETALREIASGYPSPADARLGRLMQIARAALSVQTGANTSHD